MTIRTKAELLALFADNTTGDISARDLRDFVDSNLTQNVQSESSSGQTINALSDFFVFEPGATDAILPDAVTYGSRGVELANASGGPVVINASGSDTVDGGASIIIDHEQYARLYPQGTDWAVVIKTVTDKREFSLQVGASGVTVAGAYFKSADVTMDDVNMGFAMPLSATLKVASIQRSDVDAADVEILKNGVVVETIASTTATTLDLTLNTEFAGGDLLSVRNKAGGNSMSNVVVLMIFQRTL